MTLRALGKQHAARVTVTGIASALFLLSLSSQLAPEAIGRMAASVQFKQDVLRPIDNGRPYASIRAVHPQLRRFDAWISSVGAAIALADIQGTGRPADVCLVDPRNDTVSVMPAPGTEEQGKMRFAPFHLEPRDLPYDAATMAPMGCLVGDVNEDGRADVLVYYWGRTPVLFLRRGSRELARSGFEEIEVVKGGGRWFTNAALFADVDGDGHPDLVIGNYFRDGDRILDASAIEGAEMQHSMSRAYNGGGKHLLLWQPMAADWGPFREVPMGLPEEVNRGWTLALGAADLDGDLRPELYLANDFGPDRLLRNISTPGKPAFQLVEGTRDWLTPRSKVLGRDSFKGMGVDFADVDGDGRFDIAVSNIAQEYALLESHFLFMHSREPDAWMRPGVAPYRDESGPRGTWKSAWAWDVKFADVANVGHPAILQAVGFLKGSANRWPELQELAMSNDELLKTSLPWPQFGAGDDLSGNEHDRLFVQDEQGRYHDIGREAGFETGTVSRGIAVADVFGDGRLSIAVARQWMPSLFFRNVSPRAGRSLVLDLRVPGAVAGTRPAIGAVVTVTLPDGTQRRSFVDGGSGHSGKRAPEVHFGLGHIGADVPLVIKVAMLWEGKPYEQTEVRTPGRHRIELKPPVPLAAGRGDKRSAS